MPISFGASTTSNGNVAAGTAPRAIAYAGANGVMTRFAHVAAATGQTVSTGNVTAAHSPRALLSAANDVVIARGPAPQAMAASFSTLPTVGVVFTNAPPPIAGAVGHMSQNGPTTATFKRHALASAVANIVRTCQPHQALARAFSPLSNFALMLPASPLMYSTLGQPNALLSDSLSMIDAPDALLIHTIVDALTASDAYSVLADVLQQISDSVSLQDVVALIYHVMGASSASFSSTAFGNPQLLVALIDYLTMQDGIGGTAEVIQLIASVLALSDAIQDSQFQELVSTGRLADVISGNVIAFAELVDAFRASAVLAGNALLIAFLDDSMLLGDGVGALAQILLALESGARFALTINTGDDLYTAWVMTAETKAMRSYSNFPFNSYCMLGDQLYGACATGVFKMGGPTDNGAAIQSSIRTGLMNFGSKKLKRVDRAYVGGNSQGEMFLRVCATTLSGEWVEQCYRITPDRPGELREHRVDIGRGFRSVFYRFELTNDPDGSSFEVNDWKVLPMVLTGRLI